MNDKLRAILGIASAAVAVVVPVAAPAVVVGQKILAADDAKAAINDPQTQLDAAEAAFQVVENIKGVDVGNEVLFRVGVAQIQQGFATIHAALKDHSDGTPVAPPAAPAGV